MDLPLLYTFRRCPYAIRARLAIAVAGVNVAEVEVSLRDKPAAMLAISPKGTVPVLQLPDGRVLEQSLDIMRWALAQHDPEGWSQGGDATSQALIATNDGEFKRALDRYKYPARHPDTTQTQVRDVEAAPFLQLLESRLAYLPLSPAAVQGGLIGVRMQFADAAIFPFIRQFAAVDSVWWQQSPYPCLRAWLQNWQTSPLFIQVIKK